MILPSFDRLGNLPEAIYCCNALDIYEHLVQPFPHSTERARIYDGFCLLCNEIGQLGVNATQWIDGSFTTRKLNPADQNEELEPGDIDIVTFVDYDALNALLPATQFMLRNMVASGEGTKHKYRAHTFALASCNLGHPAYPMFERNRRYFRDLFSRHSPPSTRRPADLKTPYPPEGARKGIIEITVGDPALAPRISPVRT